MTTPFGQTPWSLVPRRNENAPITLPAPFYSKYTNPERYDPDDALIAAVNISLLLGQPLVLTGEPGCGKTMLAFWLARQLGLGVPLIHNVKSNTTGRDILYQFDELRRFRDAQVGTPIRGESYLTFNGLGLAILFSAGSEAEFEMKDDGAPLSSRAATGVVRRYSELYREAFTGPRRCVVLIDELDKAPRDTPNDLLGEIERMEFQISELGVEIRGDQKFRPIVVVTSNSEKGLPDPFLRRCVYHNIEAPSSERRRAIVGRQQSPFSLRGRLFDDALNLFERIRANLARPPGTAELLAWLDILEIIVRGNERSNANSLTDYQEFLPSSLGALAKSRDDLERAEAQIRFAN